MANKKLTLEELIEKTDAAKKANPLDLSSDQDLSIALMNLISLEEHFFFSGGKTGRPGFYDLINVVREMRKELMSRIVKKSTAENGEVWCISKHLLAASMRLVEVGTKAQGAGKKQDARDLFGKAYELYSLFWGINMELIDLAGVRKDESLDSKLLEWIDGKRNIGDNVQNVTPAKAETKSEIRDSKKGGLLSDLGAWVKKSVNCCIE
ncbi:MAG: hypothetical protein LBT45_00130 [Rickettsiales bacterium]|jgi:hypothetical protein|nr:hypothetical protein [Rickettsiales bacterium]